MFGSRKKHGNKEQPNPQKKKWEEELNEQGDGDDSMEIAIDKSELAKLPNSDDEEDRDNQNQKQEGTLGITFKEQPDLEEEQEDENEKSLAWMSSEDEAIAKAVDENEDEKEMNEEMNKESDRDSRTIFVSNLPIKAEDEEIKKFFAQFGYVTEIDVPRNEGAKVNKGRAFIEYATFEDASKALSANGAKFDSCFLSITQGLNNATTNLANSLQKQPVLLTFTDASTNKKPQHDSEMEEEQEIQMDKDEDEDEEEGEGEGEEGDQEGSDDDDNDSNNSEKIKSVDSDSESDDSSQRRKNKKAAEGPQRKRERSRSRERMTENKNEYPNTKEKNLPGSHSKRPAKKGR